MLPYKILPFTNHDADCYMATPYVFHAETREEAVGNIKKFLEEQAKAPVRAFVSIPRDTYRLCCFIREGEYDQDGKPVFQRHGAVGTHDPRHFRTGAWIADYIREQ